MLKNIEVVKTMAANMVLVAVKRVVKKMWMVKRAMLQRVVMVVQRGC